jgi:dolichyl-phosphate-mannose-protein mannosyltransferase
MRSRLLFSAWVAWACVVLAHYYVQVLSAIGTFHAPTRRDVAAVALPVFLVAAGVAIARTPRSSRTLAKLPTRRSPPSWLAPATAAVLVCAALSTVPWVYLWPRLAATLTRFSIPALPWIGDATGRIAVAIVGATLVATATLSAGMILLRAIKSPFTSVTEHLVFAAVSGVAVISYGSLLLAVFGIYRPVTVALLVGAALAAGVPSAMTIARNMGSCPIYNRVGRRSAPWFALIVVALGYGLVAALAPEKEYDALWYHLYLPRLWLEAGHPVDLLEEFTSLYPLTWELLFGAGMTLGGVVGAKLLHFACLPLLGLIVWLAARRFFPRVSAAAAVAFVVTTPTVLWESSTAYVDLALAVHAAAASYALARYAEKRERSWGAIAALQFGLAAATKHLGILLTGVALLVFVIQAARGWRSVRVAGTHAFAIGLAAAVVPLPWYVRSWLASGNPVFPELFGVFGAYPAERWDALTEQGLAHFKAHFGMGRSPVALAALPWNITVNGAQFGGSLGPLFLVLIPGLVFAPRLRGPVAWLAIGIAGYVALWASPISSYQLRFLVPIVPALALLAASSLRTLKLRAEQSVPHGAKVLAMVVIILGTMNLPPFIPLHEADREGWSGWLTHVLRDSPVRVVLGREAEDAYLSREVPSYGAWRWINDHLVADARVLTTVGGDQLYAHRPRIPYDAAIARSGVWVGKQELGRAADALHRLGITHVLFDRRELSRLNDDWLVLASPAFQQACTVEYSDRRFFVCRVDYTRLPGRQSPPAGESPSNITPGRGRLDFSTVPRSFFSLP